MEWFIFGLFGVWFFGYLLNGFLGNGFDSSSDDEPLSSFGTVDDNEHLNLLDSDHSLTDVGIHNDHCPSINPANGLPMVGCAIDIEGNPYGMDDSSSFDDLSGSYEDDMVDSFFNNSWSSDSFDSGFDDSWSSDSF